MNSDLNNSSVSVMIFTLNEEIHLPICLAALSWCSDIIVIDSFSTDKTKSICDANKNTRFFQNKFEGFGVQRNWALDHCNPKNKWILILDADERVTHGLAQELSNIASENPRGIGAYRVRRRFYMWGRWLKYSSLYPTWVVRFVHKDRVRYINRGHAETQEVQGKIAELEHDIIDENLKGIDEWFERQNRYSSQDADYELSTESQAMPWVSLFSKNPLLRRAMLKRLGYRLPARSFLFFLYNYLYRKGFLDGKDGFVFCLMKVMYQQMLSIKKYDRQKKAKNQYE